MKNIEIGLKVLCVLVCGIRILDGILSLDTPSILFHAAFMLVFCCWEPSKKYK